MSRKPPAEEPRFTYPGVFLNITVETARDLHRAMGRWIDEQDAAHFASLDRSRLCPASDLGHPCDWPEGHRRLHHAHDWGSWAGDEGRPADHFDVRGD